MRRLAGRLFEPEAEQEAFLDALVSGKQARPALAWCESRPEEAPFRSLPPAPWQPDWVDHVEPLQNPGRHPLHEGGAYYCLDLSSVFAGGVLSQLPSSPSLVVDCCASPGGKAILADRALAPQLLVANEVIGKRLPALISNLERCVRSPWQVVSAEVEKLAEALGAAADLVLVDAPCSGQSLVARGQEAPGAFHPATINLNVNRQRRILAGAARLVRPGGHLVYSTCTFSPRENEGNVSWFLRKHPTFRALPSAVHADHQVPDQDGIPTYRLLPHQGWGAGGFVALLQRLPGEEPNNLQVRPGETFLRIIRQGEGAEKNSSSQA